ncbi:helix-turn-helix transcriptional regulator [Caldifermentibacillus hisashii]|uniref:helix-turn-helix domain-containing protein n=1 Tax=Caldifermentibacillus hisashii TaxID=996558 RepID=UPI0022B987BC|nr:helix-turn-helix transcriptional regulator [Caldifermentibacillus hisashii]MED4852196.1 helix-turn-helix transcriptional regulator [Caldifermentibacillus hisashii]
MARKRKHNTNTIEDNKLIFGYKEGMKVTMNEAVVYRIKSLCEKFDMSVYELSKRSGVTQSTINEILRGITKNPRIATLSKVAQGFGMDLTNFFDDPIFKYVIDEEDNN